MWPEFGLEDESLEDEVRMIFKLVGGVVAAVMVTGALAAPAEAAAPSRCATGNATEHGAQTKPVHKNLGAVKVAASLRRGEMLLLAPTRARVTTCSRTKLFLPTAGLARV